MMCRNRWCRMREAATRSSAIRSLLVVLTVLAMTAACGSRSRRVVPELAKPLPGTVAPAASSSIELIAESSGNIVMVTVFNHTNKELLLGPKMFGVIADGKLHVVDPRSVTIKFPARAVPRNQGISGAFQFRGLKPLEGQKLVLNSPEAGQMYVIIQPYQARRPDYTITTRVEDTSRLRSIQRSQEKLRETLLEELKKQPVPPPAR